MGASSEIDPEEAERLAASFRPSWETDDEPAAPQEPPSPPKTPSEPPTRGLRPSDSALVSAPQAPPARVDVEEPRDSVIVAAAQPLNGRTSLGLQPMDPPPPRPLAPTTPITTATAALAQFPITPPPPAPDPVHVPVPAVAPLPPAQTVGMDRWPQAAVAPAAGSPDDSLRMSFAPKGPRKGLVLGGVGVVALLGGIFGLRAAMTNDTPVPVPSAATVAATGPAIPPPSPVERTAAARVAPTPAPATPAPEATAARRPVAAAPPPEPPPPVERAVHAPKGGHAVAAPVDIPPRAPRAAPPKPERPAAARAGAKPGSGIVRDNPF